jgi:hypothetical protein
MRYLIEAEYRTANAEKRPRVTAQYAAELRHELSIRNLEWARENAAVHEATLGGSPAVLYSEDGLGGHGNFIRPSYERILTNPLWVKRLSKVHTSSRRALLSRDPGRKELDSSHSSDALLMNIFCHPVTLSTPAVRRLLGIETEVQALFGYKPRTPLMNGKVDSTEIDLKLGDLLIEAKLTEYDFQQAPRRLVERYPRFAEVFDTEHPDISGSMIESYQLIRGVLAAEAFPGHRFCVLSDARRPDLVTRWHRLLLRVIPHELRCRMMILTWQELASVLPAELREFLDAKYGIVP